MITGFNTDVDLLGRVYHVQTEDKGLENPVVETLIYCGGEIVTSRRSSYEELISAADFSEELILHRMETQHNALILDIRNGKYDLDAKKPFGHNIITNRSLDEVVVCFLQQHYLEVKGTRKTKPQAIRIAMIDHQVFLPCTRPTLRLNVFQGAGRHPVGDARVTITLLTVSGERHELFAAATDGDGFVEACFEIPEVTADGAEIVCEAETGKLRAELRQQVQPVTAKVE